MQKLMTRSIACLLVSLLIGNISADPTPYFDQEDNIIRSGGVADPENGKDFAKFAAILGPDEDPDIEILVNNNIDTGSTVLPGTPVNDNIVFDPETSRLLLNELAIGTDSYQAGYLLRVQDNINTNTLEEIALTLDALTVQNLTISYDNDFGVDKLQIITPSTARLANQFNCTWFLLMGNFNLSCGGGASFWSFAEVAEDILKGPGFASGTFDHFGQNGSATLRLDSLDWEEKFLIEHLDRENNLGFNADVVWSDGSPVTPAQAIQLTQDSGAFYFNEDSTIPDVTLRVLNACDNHDNFWVYVDANTELKFDLSITDTLTGETRTYQNDLGNAFDPVADTAAFANCHTAQLALMTIDSDGNATEAMISGGVTINDGVTYNKNATVKEGDTINVEFTVKPAPEHVGQSAGIVVAVEDKNTGVITVLNGDDGLFYPLDELNPKLFQTITLSAENNLEVAKDVAITAAEVGLDVNIHVGYIVGGVIHYNNEAVSLSVE